MRYLLIILGIGFLMKNLEAQSNFKTENDSFLFWQPNIKLEFQDYKGDTNTNGMNLCRKYDIHNIAEVHINSILDVPKKKGKRGKLLEKAYFAPVFCKYCSFSIKEDSIEVMHDQLFLDIAEYCSRTARIKLDSLRQIMPGYGTYWIMYSTVKANMDELMQNMFSSYGYELLVKKDSSAYDRWREAIKKGLENTKQFATKPEDCYRLLSNIPVDINYIKSETIMPPMKK
jgi:hypothetical protein